MSKENWVHILANGAAKQIEVLNPTFSKGTLSTIEKMKPELLDEDGKPKEATVDLANTLKRNIYSDFFKKPFKNLLILTGAGSSMDVGGPSMYALWDKAEELYNSSGVDSFSIIKDSINFKSQQKDLEALLSQIDGYCKFAGDISIKINGSDVKLSEIKQNLLDLIKENVSLGMPEGFFPHELFLKKLLQRKQTNPRIKIFTLNYDLLFEHAANKVNAIVIDGFSFTFPRTFSGRFFDYDIVQREGSKLHEEDNFIQRVFHLHKLHGSLNWERLADEKIVISNAPKSPLMVYPREAKYENSYEQPFFEMMARFQRNLRINTDTLLICVGYSFNDKHINAAIEEALNQNPGFRLAIIDPGFDSSEAAKSLKEIKKASLDSERILLVSETFSDFAHYFPEIKTYDNDSQPIINLSNEKQQEQSV